MVPVNKVVEEKCSLCGERMDKKDHKFMVL